MTSLFQYDSQEALVSLRSEHMVFAAMKVPLVADIVGYYLVDRTSPGPYKVTLYI